MSMHIKDTPYKLLDISGRAKKILKRLSVKTIDDLLRIPKKIIAVQIGAGVKTVSEIIKLRRICKDKLDEIDERSALLDSPMEKVVKDFKSWYVLKYFDISTIGDMLGMDPDALVLPRGYGKLTRKRIRAYIKEIRSGVQIEEEDDSIEITTFSTKNICNLFPFFGASEWTAQKALAVKQLNLDGLRISSISPPDRINRKFSGDETLTRLLVTSPSEFFRVGGMGKKTYIETRKCILDFISELRRQRKEEKDRPENDLNNFPLFMSSPVSMLEDIFKREKDPRIVRAFIMRNGVGREGGMKLREIGAYFNLTRERVRQINNEAWGVLEKPFYCQLFRPCIDALYKAFSEKSYILSPRDAQSRFQELMKWTDVLPIRVLIRLHGKLDMDDYAFRLFHVGERKYIWMAHAACHECERLVDAIRNRAIPDGSLSMEKWVKSITRGVRAACSNCETAPVASRKLGYYFLEKIYGSGNYFADDSSIIYVGKAIRFRRGTMRGTILAILEEAPLAMTTKEIETRLHRLRPEKEKYINKKAIWGRIKRAPAAIPWGRGGYAIHRKHVRTTTPLLGRLEREAIDLVNSDTPMLSTLRLFSDNKRECVAAGIPNEYALYSCLKLRNSPRLFFPRAPCIMKPGYA